MSEDAPDPDDLHERLETVADDLEAAETEADLDEIEVELDDLEEAIETLEDDEDIEDEALDELTENLGDRRDALEEARGPYASDVIEALEGLADDIDAATWTDDGAAAVSEAVTALLTEELPEDLQRDAPTDFDELAGAVTTLAADIDPDAYDPDEDADHIEAALDAIEAATDAVDEAEQWSDLSMREKLQERGFYDVLDHRKDYPPEWSAIKAHEQAGNVEMILLGLEHFDSEFMEDNCLESLKRLGAPEATEAMMDRAQRRDQDAIEVLGRIGTDEPVEMLAEFLEEGAARPLTLVTLQALGRIGSPAATQAVANKLAADDPLVRSTAARALGMIGDTRAIDPLTDRLEEDEAGTVRGSAAWALNQIGTTEALEAVVAYEADREYLVEVQAERAADRLAEEAA